ncbi:MAG TPA: DUF4288 domain-containing protein [Flavisolibacter sp.]|nr:DUF4288 domain-containing protein [Flavisolibacter sp.]
MNWYVTKIIYQIICGQGEHTAQFDEQIRLISASDETEAYGKIEVTGYAEEEVFCNDKQELVQWKFIGVAELYKLSHLIDGAEIYSRITEVEDARLYIHGVRQKAASIREKTTHQLLHLI